LRRWLAQVNRHVTNRLVSPAARYLPGFGVVLHVGRKSGRRYRTPVNVFRRPGGWIIALMYGPNADWVRNVRATNGCTLQTRGGTVRLAQPHVYRDDEHLNGPAFLRVYGRIAGAVYFLDLADEDGAGGDSRT
jgi:deazaflavin-dependent oxidoreductase (nitroreductase family)